MAEDMVEAVLATDAERSEDTQTLPEGKVYALNSKRLLAVHVKAITQGLGLPTRAAVDELRQMINRHHEGDEVEPANVQVILQEEVKCQFLYF